MSKVDVSTYVDPACPWAYSAEPIRFRIAWRYGDQINWKLRLVGLSKDGSNYQKMGFTPEVAAKSLESFAHYGQPLAQVPSRPVGATWQACQAIVGARERLGLKQGTALLHALQRAALAEAKDLAEETTIVDAATSVGLDGQQILAWSQEADVIAAFERDLSASRRPGPAALALDAKLAASGDDWTHDADGPMHPRRYTCPSYTASCNGLTLEAPGMQPTIAIETLIANAAPDLTLRAWATDPVEVLTWAGEPMSTQEVAAVMDLEADRQQVRDLLAKSAANESIVGSDSIWQI